MEGSSPCPSTAVGSHRPLPVNCWHGDEHTVVVEVSAGGGAILTGLFERFTDSARDAVVLAQDEARRLGRNAIGTEHLLLGVMRDEHSVAAQVLQSLGITVEVVREQVADIAGPAEDEITGGGLPFTPRAKKALEVALRESLALGHHDIGPEHLLLGVARADGGVAKQILLGFGADFGTIRR